MKFVIIAYFDDSEPLLRFEKEIRVLQKQSDINNDKANGGKFNYDDTE